MQEMWEIWVWSLGQEDPLEEDTAIQSSVLNWRIPWTEEPGGLQSVEPQRIRLDWVTDTLAFCSVPRTVMGVFNWSTVDLQCCVSFWRTTKWFSDTCKYIKYTFYNISCVCTFFFMSFPLWFIPMLILSCQYDLLQHIKYILLCCTVGPCCFVVYFMHSSVYLLIPNS